MNKQAKGFFQQLLAAPGVSGYEEPVQRVVSQYAQGFASHLQTDLHGNLILAAAPDRDLRIMLAGHADQIGLLVSQIDETGVLYTQTVGGWDAQQLIGQRMTVWTRQGPVPGVISRKAIHLMDESERKRGVKTDDLWIDIGADDQAEAQALVQIGDPVTLDLGIRELRNGCVTAPALDNRCGVWVAVEALRRACDLQPEAGVFAVSTVQEEIGLRGAKTAAYAIDPQIGIAIDVTHATDSPTVDKRQQGDIKLGQGPVIVRGPNVNPKVAERLINVCRAQDIPYQVAALGRAAPNDSNALQINRSGVATGLVAIPNRYMHSAVEVVNLADIDHAAELLAHFCASVHAADEFIPG